MRLFERIEVVKTICLGVFEVVRTTIKLLWSTCISFSVNSRVASLTSSIRSHWLRIWIIEETPILEAFPNVHVPKLWHFFVFSSDLRVESIFLTPEVVGGFLMQVILREVARRVLLLLFRFLKLSEHFFITSRRLVRIEVLMVPVLLVHVISWMTSDWSCGHKFHFIN